MAAPYRALSLSLLLAAAPVRAAAEQGAAAGVPGTAKAPEPPAVATAPARDPEQLGDDMVRDIDGWIGRVSAKLESGDTIGPGDFDSIFTDSFFSSSEDPLKDIERVQKKTDSRLGGNKQKFNDSYARWVAGKMFPADLKPEVLTDKSHITVKFRAPEADSGPVKITVEGGRIKITYLEREKRQAKGPDGGVSASSSMKRRQRAMPVPEGADQDRYRIKTAKGLVNIIFDRVKGKKSPEVAK